MKTKPVLPGLLLSIFLPPQAFAEPMPAAEMAALSKNDFLNELETIHEEAWPSLSLMFTRLDPSFEAKLPPYGEWDDQMRTLTACVYDTLAEQGQLQTLAEYAVTQLELAEVLENDQNLNMLTLENNAELQERFGNPVPDYIAASSACGLLSYQGQLMQESGLMDALIAKMQ